jgi:protein tyrosine/serine phosphatase
MTKLILSASILSLSLPTLAFARESTAPIPRFLKVAPGIYRGGSPGEEGVAFLKKKGFKTVITFEGRKKVVKAEKEAVEKAGMRFVESPITLFNLPDDDRIDDLLQIIANPKNHPVFVHCRAGRDRTGLMIALYRAEVQKWDPAHAWAEAMQNGFRKFYFPLVNIFEHRTGYDI